MLRLISIAFFLFISVKARGQEKLLLWPEGFVPNQKVGQEKERITETDIVRIENVQNPSIEIYLPSKSIRTGKAVVIFPGGGYRFLAYDWEGTDFAKALNASGIAAFVLKYRLPTSESIIDPKWAPLQDAQRAIRLVRFHAKKWSVDPTKVGIMGFSAGGHLASTLGTHYDRETLVHSKDTIDRFNARPDFMALIYPVITFDKKHYHGGSKNNLIGPNASADLVDKFSNDLNVNPNTPPAFLVHSADDKAVPIANSLLFYNALIKNGVSAEMHLYPKGGHGYALARGKGSLKDWPQLLFNWIHELN
ncbi:MAG: alpha/beta hydrolase [Flavobacteriaceae bacterium]|nr:alpha/beta hydrolase [Flavobacteriaceae bacterium]